MKAVPEDFLVEEELSFEPSGDGPHHYLYVEKTGCNTPWVATRLARHAGVRAADVGYAGLKDRHARTRQWFSVPLNESHPTDWSNFAAEGVVVQEVTRNRRKLRRGALRCNRFRVRLTGMDADMDRVGERLARIAAVGVPNYFGPQRFGRQGGNLDLAKRLFAAGRLRRRDRQFALSAARALIFNELLARRVEQDNWDGLIGGDILILDGRGSVFAADPADADVGNRVARGELHPTGPLWGRGEPRPVGEAGRLESEVSSIWSGFAEGLEAAGTVMGRRSLRLVPRGLRWQPEDGGRCLLEFSLPAGEYATTLVRELVDTD
ncbi:MAG: tRNA pseudouridine(13) synthase TruD [Gammaproteobacteria bacterium]|jgi:tRNA pseudouridine13 synthase